MKTFELIPVSVLLLLHLYLTGSDALRCYQCRDVIDIRDCDQIVECYDQCYYHKGASASSFDMRWDLGCMGTRQCQAIEHYSSGSKFPVGCCNNVDFCNGIHIGKQPTGVPTSTYPQTTIPSPKIVINAPDKAAYQSMVQLSCVTIPPADRYSWKFNGTSSLPVGVSVVQYTPNQGAVAGTDVLTIVKIDKTNFGSYTCAGTVHGQTVESSHFINIMPETIPSVVTG